MAIVEDKPLCSVGEDTSRWQMVEASFGGKAGRCETLQDRGICCANIGINQLLAHAAMLLAVWLAVVKFLFLDYFAKVESCNFGCSSKAALSLRHGDAAIHASKRRGVICIYAATGSFREYIDISCP